MKKTAFTFFLKSAAKGETPIEKNIMVVDEQGNEYEATWPKRAKGLVKNGRARFISDNKICLACPPDINLEDDIMSDKMIYEAGMEMVQQAGAAARQIDALPMAEERPSMGYILRQMEKILEQKDYLHEAIASLSKMADGDTGDCGAPGNLLGQAKAHALRDVVVHREATNQQMLKMYEQMYFDLQGRHD